jgi:hypothetical protein
MQEPSQPRPSPPRPSSSFRPPPSPRHSHSPPLWRPSPPPPAAARDDTRDEAKYYLATPGTAAQAYGWAALLQSRRVLRAVGFVNCSRGTWAREELRELRRAHAERFSHRLDFKAHQEQPVERLGHERRIVVVIRGDRQLSATRAALPEVRWAVQFRWLSVC